MVSAHPVPFWRATSLPGAGFNDFPCTCKGEKKTHRRLVKQAVRLSLLPSRALLLHEQAVKAPGDNFCSLIFKTKLKLDEERTACGHQTGPSTEGSAFTHRSTPNGVRRAGLGHLFTPQLLVQLPFLRLLSGCKHTSRPAVLRQLNNPLNRYRRTSFAPN